MEENSTLQNLADTLEQLCADKPKQDAADTVRLLTAVQAGDLEALRHWSAAMVDATKESFACEFIPGHIMKGTGEPAGDPLQFTVQIPRLRDGQRPAVDQMEGAYNGFLAAFLVPAQKAVWDRLVCTHAENVTPQDLWAIVRQSEKLPGYLVAGSLFLRALMKNPEWHPHYSPAEKKELFVTGHAGRVFTLLDVYSDLYRYDTMRVLDDDAIYCIAAEPDVQVWWDWVATGTDLTLQLYCV